MHTLLSDYEHTLHEMYPSLLRVNLNQLSESADLIGQASPASCPFQLLQGCRGIVSVDWY